MSSFSWLRWLRSFRRPKVKTYRRRPARLPHLEELESRLAPASHQWSGLGGNSNWTTAANWTNGAPVAGDDLVFPLLTNPSTSALSPTNDFTAGTNFHSITISGKNYNFGGSPLTLGGTSGGTVIIVGAGASGNQFLSGMDLTMVGQSTDQSSILVSSGGTLTIASHLFGQDRITKDDVGTLTLTADNSLFTGNIDIVQGIVAITNGNALGGASDTTTVEGASSKFGQLQLISTTGFTINESLVLNGRGPTNDGALLNVSGNNTVAGGVLLDSDVTIGSATGVLTITGQISDGGSGHNLTKEGAGQLVFTNNNAYRGSTTINNGILTIEAPGALGVGGSPASGTFVTQIGNETGELQIDDPNFATDGGGFTVLNNQLTLNGAGIGGVGALTNARGNNTWANFVTLGSPAPTGKAVSIGESLTGAANSLTISGVIQDRALPDAPVALTKVGVGKVILNNANTYLGGTTVAAGTLNIRDSQALGTAGTAGGVTVNNGATLELQVDTGFDAFGRNLSIDSITGQTGNGPQLGLTIANNLNIAGTGVGNAGAVHSISGINKWTGNVSLGNITNSTQASVGVDSDPNPSNTSAYFTNDYSLTISGAISDGVGRPQLIKTGTGQLILPTGNTYTGGTSIQQGWITIENNQSLGGFIPGLPDTQQPVTTVLTGAALHLKALAGNSLNVVENLVLAGNGITHPFQLINQKGALMNLSGNNTIGGPFNVGGTIRSSFIHLNGVAGIGVETVFGQSLANNELAISASIADAVGTTGGGITKFGSDRLDLQGDGTYSGAVNINEGVLRVQNNTALGQATTGTSLSQPNVFSNTTTTVGSGIGEVQSFTITGSTTGTYTLTFNGQTTAAIAATATAAQVQTTLNALSSISGVGGSVTVNQSGNLFTVLFGGAFQGVNMPQLTGTGASGTTVTGVTTLVDGDGAAMELQNPVTTLNGGVTAGLTVFNEHLVLNGTGNQKFGDVAPINVFTSDNMWHGGVTLKTATTFNIQPNARLNIFGTVDDIPNILASGSDLTLAGGGILALAGSNTYRGTTFVNQGTLQIQNGQALGGTGVAAVQTITVGGATTGSFRLTFNGQTTTSLNANSATLAADIQTALNNLSSTKGASGSVTVTGAANVFTVTFGGGSLFGFTQPTMTAAGSGGTTVTIGTLVRGGGGTIVANGASVQLEGSVTVAGEPLILQGQGTPTSTNLPQGWFPLGPAPINDGTTPPNNDSANNQSVSGRVTSVIADPRDPNVIYIGTAGGGAWKTTNGGLTWLPLFDGLNEVQTVNVTGAGTFSLNFDGQNTIALNTGASALAVQNALNALSNIGGSGGSVSVTAAGGLYTITFNGGTLAGVDLPQFTVNSTTGTAAVGITTQTDGRHSMTVGAITLDPTNSQIIYIGTGEANNSSDSFYGTGVYKSTDAGRTWSLVTGQSVQTITVKPGTAATETFTLTFNGVTTAALGATPTAATAAQVQTALNGLSSIGGVGGSVTVTGGGGAPYVVTFGGTLATTSLLISATGTPAPGATGGPTVATAVTNFANPFVGKGISKIIVDPNIPTRLYVADGDGGVNANEVQTFNFALPPGLQFFTVTFIGVDSTGTIVTDTTPTITYDPTNKNNDQQVANDIQAYLQGGVLSAQDTHNPGAAVAGFSNIAGIGGTVTVAAPVQNPSGPITSVVQSGGNVIIFTNNGATNGLNNGDQVRIQGVNLSGGGFGGFQVTNVTANSFQINNVTLRSPYNGGGNWQKRGFGGGGGGGGGRNNTFTITFGGQLSNTNVNQLTTNWPQPAPGVFGIATNTRIQGGKGKVVNGTSGNAGVWRLDGNPAVWFDLTNVISANRNATTGVASANGTLPTPNPNPPGTPGPDDNYLVAFPQSNTTWSDLALDANGNLFAALGKSDGDVSNGVFYTRNPTSNTPVWLVGDPLAGGTFTPDNRSASEFPVGIFTGSVGGAGTGTAIFGNIKITETFNQFLPGYGGDTLYAVVATPTGQLQNIYFTNDATYGQQSTGTNTAYAPVGSLPANLVVNQGAFDLAILVDSNNPLHLFIAGDEVSNTAHTQAIWESFDGGTTWNDITVDGSGDAPHTAIHSLSLDNQGRLLVASDGGLWRRETSGSWNNLTANLNVADINSVAVNPTDPTIVYAGSQNTGTEVYSGNNQAWTMTDAGSGGTVQVDPQNPLNVYHVQFRLDANTAAVRRSTDGGQTWTTILATNNTNMPIALDQINPNRLVVGGNAPNPSLRETFNATAAVPTFVTINPPPIITGNVTVIALAQFQGAFLADPGFNLVTDQGADSYDPNTIYVSDGSQIFVTKDHGQTWVNRTITVNGVQVTGIADLEVDPRNRDTVYAIVNRFGGSQVFTSNNAGQSWTDITANVFNTVQTITLSGPASGSFTLSFSGSTTSNLSNGSATLALDIQNALNNLNSIGGQGGLVTVTGAGNVFTVTFLGGFAGVDEAPPTGPGLTSAGSNPATIATLQHGSTSVFPDVPKWAATVDPRNGNLYVAADDGVWELPSGTTHWQRVGTGLPNVAVHSIELNQTTNSLVIGTYGRGVWQLFLDNSTANAGALEAVSGTSTWTGPIFLVGNNPGDTVSIGVDGAQEPQNGITAAQLNIVGTITSLVPGTNDKLLKVGQGTLILSAPNTYGGMTEVQQGVLIVHNPKALGTITLETQTVTVTGGAGTFTLTFNGQTTSALAFNATAAQVQAALDGLSTIGGIGGFVNVTLTGNVYTVQFAGALTGLAQPLLAATPAAGASTAVTETSIGSGITLDQQTLTLTTGAATDTFKLNFNGQTTSTLTVGSPTLASDIQSALNTLLGTSGVATVTSVGNVFTVTFSGLMAGFDQPLLTATVTGTSTVAIATLTHGAGGTLVDPNTAQGSGPSLELQTNLDFTPVQINGTGFQLNGHDTGALRNVSGSNRFTGNLILNTNSTIGVDSNTTLTIQGTGTISATSPTFSLTKELTGTLILDNPDSYSGGTFLNAGALQIQNGLALGSAVATSAVMDGAQLQLQNPTGGPAVAVSPNQSLTLSGTGIGGTGALVDIGGSNSWLGNITFNENPGFSPDTTPNGAVAIGVANAADTLTIAGTINEALPTGLSKVGPGKLVLTQQDGYSGSTYVNSGIVNIQNPGALGTFSEVQLIDLGGTTQGTFTLTFNGQTTGALAFNVPASGGVGPTASIQNALNALSSIGPAGSVTVTGNAGGPYSVTFNGGSLANLPQNLLTIAQTNFTVGSTATVAEITNGGVAHNELQRLTVTGSAIGTFTLTFNGQTTAVLNSGATSAQIAAALNGLSSIGGVGGSVSVSSTSVTAQDGNAETIYTITFGGTLAGVKSPLISALGANSAVVAVSTVSDGGLGVQVSNGATLQVQGGMTVLPDLLALNGNGVGNAGALENVNGTNTWTGSITLQSNTSIGVDPTTQLTVSGTVQDPVATPVPAASLTKLGTGTLIFPNANTYAGKTTVSAGVLNIRNGGALGRTAETQTVTLGGTITGGTFRLTFNGQTTGPIASTATGAQLMTALQGLPTIGATGISNVTRVGNVFFITFGGALSSIGNQPLLTAGAVTGGTTVTIGEITETQAVTVLGASGTFTLSFNGQTTAALNIGANAAQVQAALNALSSVNGVGGTVNVVQNGNVYTIFFDGTLALANQPQLGAAGFNGASVGVSTLRDGPEGTLVSNGATLQVQGGITVSAEPLTLNGAGVNNAGALENVIGTNTWATPVTLGSNSFIGVDVNTDTLVINQPIGDKGLNFGVTEVGPGTLDYAGGATTSNTYTGLTQINQGTLLLDKSGGAMALNGNLTVGDSLAGVAVAQWNFSNEMPTTATVTVSSDGTMNLNDQTQTIASLIITDGTAMTGSGSHGTQNGLLTVSSLNMTGGTVNLGTVGSELVLNGNATAISDGPAMINGSGTLLLGSNNDTFTVNHGPNPVDLIVSAPISSTAAGGITKQGAGLMQITNANPNYLGTSTINAGNVQVDGTIGNVVLGGGTVSGTGTVGTITGPATVAGTVSPGDSVSANPIGTLTSSADTWGTGTSFAVDLTHTSVGAPVAGTDNDLLVANGNVNLGGAFLTGTAGPGIQIGDHFIILSYGTHTLTGMFAQGTSAFVGGEAFTIDYGNTAGAFSPGNVVLLRVKNTATMAITSSVNPSIYGQDVVFTATITPQTGAGSPPAGGQVTFELDGNPALTKVVTISGNTATFDPQADLSPAFSWATGTHTIDAVYHDPTGSFLDATAPTFTQLVNKSPTATTLALSPTNNPVFGQTVTVVATVGINTPPVTANPAPIGGQPSSGTVSFFLDGSTTAFATVAVDSTGHAQAPLSGLSLSLHHVTAVYSGDSNYAGSSTATALTITVGKANSSVNVSANPTSGSFGQSVTFTATVTAASPGSGTPTGSVQFFDGPAIQANSLGTASVIGGVAKLSTTGVHVGSNTITAVFTGDVNFNGNTGTLTGFVVNAANASIVIAPTTASSTFGQTLTFTATVSAVSPATGTPTGTVTFVINGTPQTTSVALNGAGQATLIISNLPAGADTVGATYNGDSTFGSVSTITPANVTVSAANSSTALALAPNPSVFGQSVTFTATVTAVAPGAGIPSGTVNFVEGTNTLGSGTLNASGVATFTTSTLSVGTHAIVAQYVANGNFHSSTSSSQTQTVNQSTSATTLMSSGSPSVFGQSVTLTATVSAAGSGSGTPTGTVNFVEGTTTLGTGTLGGGVATFTSSSLSVGPHNIVAQYVGSANFGASNSPVFTQQVNKANTGVALGTSGSPSNFGASVTFTATVTAVGPGAGTPTGTVTFDDGTTPIGTGTLSGGVATFTTSTLSVATHSITAVYGGDLNFNGNTSNAVSQTINSTSTNTVLTSSANPGGVGQPITFTATVTGIGGGTPTGMVNFIIDGGTPTSVAVNTSGVATFITAFSTSPSTHTVEADYLGTSGFGSSSDMLTENILLATTTSLVAAPTSPSTFGQNVTFTATVTPVAGGTPTGTVSFFDGAAIPANLIGGPVTISPAGVATFSTTLLSGGAHTINAVYSGDANFAVSTGTVGYTVNLAGTTTTLSASPTTTTFSQNVTFTATVSSAAGTPGGTVTFMDGTNMLGTVSLSGGVAMLSTTTLTGGPHTITANYSGDTNFSTSSDSISPFTVSLAGSNTVLAASPTSPSSFGQPVTFTATVSSSFGVPTGTVTFMDGSNTLATGTLSGGVATFTTSALTVGLHAVISAVYNSDGNFLTSTGTVNNFTVNAAGTSTTVTDSPAGTSANGQSVTLTAHVVATGGSTATVNTGTVTFKDGTTTLGTGTVNASGIATFTTAALAVGAHANITAVYGLTTNFGGSTSAAISHTVSALKFATTAVTESAATSVFGQGVTFTATVTGTGGTPTGSVTFFSLDGSLTPTTVTLTAGKATFVISGFGVGAHTVSAKYNGDSVFAANTGASPTATLTVSKASTTVTVTSSAPTTTSGTPVTFTAAVAAVAPGGGTPTGQVQFKIDNVLQATLATIVNGKATFTVSNLTVGTHTVSAMYIGGDSRYNVSPQSAAITETIQSPATKLVTQTSTTAISPNVAFNLAVYAENSTSNVVSSFNGPVTLTVLSTPTGGALTNSSGVKAPLTATFVNGIAVFTGIKVSLAGSYVVRLTAANGLFVNITITTLGRQT
jgi:autotransporter-associated beta strand protein